MRRCLSVQHEARPPASMTKPPSARDGETPTARAFVREAVGDWETLRRRLLDLAYEVTLCDEVSTARVRRSGGRCLLEIGTHFAQTHLGAQEDKRFVLLHELFHLERGDLLRTGRYFRRYPKLVNLALDIYVNSSVLSSTIAFPKGLPTLPDRLYAADSFPACFLLPPWSLAAHAAAPRGAGPVRSRRSPARPQAPYALSAQGRVVARRLHADWLEDLTVTEAHRLSFPYARIGPHRYAHFVRETGSPSPAVAAEVEAVLRRAFGPLSGRARIEAGVRRALRAAGIQDVEEASRLYLGGWRQTLPFGRFLSGLLRLMRREGRLGELDRLAIFLEQALEDLARAAAAAGLRGLGAGSGDALERRTLDPVEAWTGGPAYRALMEAVRRAITVDAQSAVRRSRVAALQPTVVPQLGRRETLLYARGVFPPFYRRPVLAEGISHERVHLFLDVSGSMDAMLATVTGLVLHLGAQLGERVYAFSNRVVPTCLEALAQGEYETTGGTDLDCVAEYAHRARLRRILIVTDGFVSLRPESEALLRQMETYAVLISRHAWASSRSERAEYFRRVWHVTL